MRKGYNLFQLVLKVFDQLFAVSLNVLTTLHFRGTEMPFLSPDWRYPGDHWLKTNESGSMWENAKIYRLRMFETINENVVKRFVYAFA